MLQQRDSEHTMVANPVRNHEVEIAIELVMDAFSKTASHEAATELALQEADLLYAGAESAQVQKIIKQLGASMKRDARLKTMHDWIID